MSRSVEELIGALTEMVSDAWTVPLSNDKCVVERERVLDILEEIKVSMPAEFKQAKTLVENRGEIVASAKREAEAIRRQAEERGKQLVEQNEITLQARQKANDMLTAAEIKSKEVKKISSEYVDDALRRLEEATNQALNEVKQSRLKFKNITSKM